MNPLQWILRVNLTAAFCTISGLQGYLVRVISVGKYYSLIILYQQAQVKSSLTYVVLSVLKCNVI